MVRKTNTGVLALFPPGRAGYLPPHSPWHGATGPAPLDLNPVHARGDAVDKGDWWSTYHDPELDRLEYMVDASNQTVKQFEAQYRNAVALVAEARRPVPHRRPAGLVRVGSDG
jgi:outer membrane protein TolC